MATTRPVIALAGVGDLGRYVSEELLASSHFDVVILTRGSGQAWFSELDISIHKTDYSVSSILSILNTTRATTLISFINDPTPTYTTTHAAILSACCQSATCKRLIPSEWIGDTEKFPLLPEFYATSREPFRQMLREQNQVEWTLFNIGWLADYFIPKELTYIKPAPRDFPIDANDYWAIVRGTGDERQSWTCARDVARAVVELCKASEWESHTYVAAEWGTFNSAIKTMESFYSVEMGRSHRTLDDIGHALATSSTMEASISAQIEQMTVLECLACPKAKTLRQRERYFKNLEFLTLEDLLACAESDDII